MEYDEYAEGLCPGCGLPKHESFHPDNEQAYTAEPLACAACATRQRKARIFGEGENSVTDGVYWVITRDAD